MAKCAFTDSDGLPGRIWNKHLIYGPTKENDYCSSFFSGISESLQKAAHTNISKQWSTLQHEIWRVSQAIDRAARVLHGELT
jgi:N-acetylated-alpha-linked acidic dipeptidase